MDCRAHWQGVYAAKGDLDLSWFEPVPTVSLELMTAAGLAPGTRVIDVGGGSSRHVDALVERGVRAVTVLDISRSAIERSRRRLGAAAAIPTWIEADLTGAWSVSPVDIWHDRAVFHFLTSPNDRARYLERLHETLQVGGTAIIATFALDGPERCSGLPVCRYSAASLSLELGKAYRLVESRSHRHHAPWGAPQSFQYSRFLKTA